MQHLTFRDSNQAVAKARDRVILDGIASGYNMELIQWDKQYKGIDDFLLAKMQGVTGLSQ